MRLTLAAAASALLFAVSAVSALSLEEARELRPHLNEYLGRGDGDGDAGAGLARRNFCTDHWKTCENCFEKYPYCHMDNFLSSINW
jgi:hypothetical protein